MKITRLSPAIAAGVLAIGLAVFASTRSPSNIQPALNDDVAQSASLMPAAPATD